MQKKTKKIIVYASAFLGLIFGLVILNYTLFKTDSSKLQINFLNQTTMFFSQESKDEILQSVELNSSSVLFLNKTIIKNEIEKQFAYIKVVNIETVFPNNIVLQLAEREEVFCFDDLIIDKYIIVDEDLKILDIITKSSFENNQNSPIILKVEDLHIQQIIEYNIGDFLNGFEGSEIVKNLVKSFLINNRTIAEQKALIKTLTVKFDPLKKVLYGEEIYLELTDFNNFLILIYAPSEDLNAKIQAMFSCLSTAVPSYLQTHYMEVLKNNEGIIICKLSSLQND